MNAKTITIPTTGVRCADVPCPECLILIERALASSGYPGQQVDCYACNNRHTLVDTSERDRELVERHSVRDDDGPTSWKLVGTVFNKSKMDEGGVVRWLESNGFPTTGQPNYRGMELVEYSFEETTHEPVYVGLAPNVLGRVAEIRS